MTAYDASTTAAEAGWTPFSDPPLTLTSLPTPTYTSFLQQLFDSLFNSLTQQLMNPMTQLQMLSTPAQFAMEPMQMAMGQLMSGANPLLSGAASVPAMDPFLASAVSPAVGGPNTAQLTGVVSAGMGRASSIGKLSVPANWANATPAPAPTPPVAEGPSPAVSPVVSSLPTTPYPPSLNVPGRLIGAVTPAVAAHRAGGAARPVLG
jgi:hypothetical protein